MLIPVLDSQPLSAKTNKPISYNKLHSVKRYMSATWRL